MLSRYLKVIKKYINKELNLKQEDGFSLVEVIVAFFIMSIITVVLVRGTMIAVDTIKVNKAKTKALAVASEKMELIRAMDYEGIELTSVNPDWGEDNPALIEDGYGISYEVSEVYVSGSSYKQIKLSISKDPMNTAINVITQIYPLAGGGEGTNPGDTTPPEAPTGLVATATGSYSIDLDWDDNTEPDLAGYKVYRDTVSGFTPDGGNFVADATSSLYSDTGLTATTTYYYRVTAVDNSSNESDPSIQADATTLSGSDTTPPEAPTGLVATATGSYSIDLDWDDNTEPDLAGYKVYRDTVSGFTPDGGNFVADATSSLYSDTGLTATTTYYYRVTAVDNSSNESDPSIQADATTLLEYTYISLPFEHDGAGEYYWKSDGFSTDPGDWSHYVNSWNLKILEINSVDYTNKWVAQHDIPPESDGYWYIYYKASSKNGHIEIGP